MPDYNLNKRLLKLEGDLKKPNRIAYIKAFKSPNTNFWAYTDKGVIEAEKIKKFEKEAKRRFKRRCYIVVYQFSDEEVQNERKFYE